MSFPASRKNFIESTEGIEMREELMEMIKSPAFNTGTLVNQGADFVEKHLSYIARFPYIDPRQYVLNLKVKSRV